MGWIPGEATPLVGVVKPVTILSACSVHDALFAQHPGLRVDTKELSNAYTPEPVKAGSAPAENSSAVYEGDVRSPYAEFGARPVTPMDRVMRRDPAG